MTRRRAGLRQYAVGSSLVDCRRTNDSRQQREADVGTVLAVRPKELASKVLDNHRKRKVGEVATLENPPGFPGLIAA